MTDFEDLLDLARELDAPARRSTAGASIAAASSRGPRSGRSRATSSRRPSGSSSPAPARRTTSPRRWPPSARAALHRPVLAAPLSELHPAPGRASSWRGRRAAEPVVVISRSGSTSEAVAVAERMRAAGHPTIGGHVPGGQPARAARRRHARLAGGRRGGDRDDPLVREHARAPAPGRRAARAATSGSRPTSAGSPERWPEARGRRRGRTPARRDATGAGSSSSAAARRSGSPPSGA